MSQQKISRYHIIESIGRGGMATVYRGFDPMFKRDVAVKVMAGEHLTDKMLRARFEREAQTIATLEHPAIVPVYDFGEQDGRLYLVMRIMTGGTLTDRLNQGALSISETSHILQRIGSALQRAHDNGIIHRDLKPSNILFDSYGDAFLADFGIARLTESTVTLTGQSVVGTPAYMSPEQIHGDKQIDGRSDIYALGVICFEMLTGQRPYEDATPAKVMMKHIIDPVPNIRKVKPDLPEGVDVVIAKTMAKAPDERYSTASEMTDTLNAISRPGVPAAPPPTQPPGALSDEPEAPTILADELDTPESMGPTGEAAAASVSTPVPVDLDAGSRAEPVPDTEVARPIFPTKPSEESKRSLTIPLVVAGLAVVVCIGVAGFVIVFSGVFAPDDEPSTPQVVDLQSTTGEIAGPVESEMAAEEEPTRLLAPDVELNLAESKQRMEEASVLFEEGNINDAFAIASQAIGLAPEFAENYFARSEMYHRTEDYDLAMDDINSAIELEPTAKYYFQRGLLSRSIGDQGRAIEDFHQSIDLDPDNPEPFIDLAIAYRQIEDFGASLEMSNMAVDIDPDNSRALAVRARTLKELGDIESALEDGLRAHELDPENWRVADNLADIYAWYLGDLYEGIIFYSRAIDLRPDEAWRYGDRAILYREIGEREAAMADLETAIELDPDVAWYRVEEGITLRDAFGDIDEALTSFERAMEIDPDDPEPYEERARTFADYIGDYEAAIAEVDRAIEIAPGQGWLYTLRAEIFQNMGDVAAAEADLIRATQLDSTDAWSFIDLGYFYFDVVGDVDPAFDAWNIAVEIDPENPHAYHARYLYYSHVLEEYDAAIDDLSRCIELDPYFPWCYWERAWIFDIVGDAESAIRDFEAYLEISDVDDCPECIQDATDYIEQH